MNQRGDTTTWQPYRPIGSLMDAAIPQVSPGTASAGVGELLARSGVERALVVDPDGTPLGIVSREDLRPNGNAAGVMKPVPIMLHASVPASIAASLMSSAGAPAVVVVSDERRAVGVLSWRELLAWIAREAGHRPPITAAGGSRP